MRRSRFVILLMSIASLYYFIVLTQCKPIPIVIEPEVALSLDSIVAFIGKQNFKDTTEWHLFPQTDVSPESDTLKRLGLPVHGRWARTYVNNIAFDYIVQAITKKHKQPLDFPIGSFVVKQNYGTKSNIEKRISPDHSQLGVYTIMYKPHPNKKHCATQHLASYNGDDCLGGEWYYSFFFASNLKRGTEIDSLSRTVQANVNTFCVNCHAPAYNTDYVRTLDNILNPFEIESDTPYCDRFEKDLQVVNENPRALETTFGKDVQAYINDAKLDYKLSGDVPYNPTKVFNDLGPKLTQEMFDSYAWKSFIALSWPNKEKTKKGVPQRGKADPKAKFNDNLTRPTVWETYKPTFEVFQPGNLNWNPKDQEWNQILPAIKGTGCDVKDYDFVVTMDSKTKEVVNETGQAFAGSFGYLVDQDSQRVRYEVLFNRTEFEYLISNGRAASKNLTPAGPKDEVNTVSFPDTRSDLKYNEGAIEVKSAWKELCLDGACNHRDALNLAEARKKFLVRNVLIYHADGDSCRTAHLALVGLHIARKTYYAPQWIWMTFEHKDNAPDALAANKQGTFYNDKLQEPDNCYALPFLSAADSIQGCPNVDLNRFVAHLADSPNQLTRLVPVNAEAQKLNSKFQNELRKIDSPLANYMLVDAQWPLHGRREDGQVNRYNCADNGVGEDCFTSQPRFLRNTVIESYMATYCTTDDGTQQFSNRSCMSCHGTAGADLSYIWLDAVSQRVALTDKH